MQYVLIRETLEEENIEVKFARCSWNSLLPFILKSEKINAFGNYFFIRKKN